MTDSKQIIIDALDIMRRSVITQTFKARAYAKVIAQLQIIPTITKYEDIASVTGVGEKIEEKIREILKTGSLKSAVRAKEEHSLDALDALMACYGIGPAKAKDLVGVHGIKSIADLREKVAVNPALLNENQIAGLTYYEDLRQRIPRTEMLEHEALLRSHIPAGACAEIVGSFRRQAETSGDIDMLLCSADHKALTDLVTALRTAGYIKKILALGEKKCMAIIALGATARRLDILLTPPGQYPFAILYFTGSDTFNIAFRQHALDRGYTLNEHALTPLLSTDPIIKTEKDIFSFLGLVYTPPEKRVGAVTHKRKIRLIKPPIITEN
jgi:DNA polymerase/3'-5' exonuclease PolX